MLRSLFFWHFAVLAQPLKCVSVCMWVSVSLEVWLLMTPRGDSAVNLQTHARTYMWTLQMSTYFQRGFVLPGKIQLVSSFHSFLFGSLSLSLSHSISPVLAACGSLWPGVARNTGAVIWTAGRSISQGPRRCEIWDTFHSTLPSFWQKERDSTKPGEQNRREAVIYTGVKSLTSLKDPGLWILSSILLYWLVFLIEWGKGELIFVILTRPLWQCSLVHWSFRCVNRWEWIASDSVLSADKHLRTQCLVIGSFWNPNTAGLQITASSCTQ